MNNRNNSAGEPADEEIRRTLLAEIANLPNRVPWTEDQLQSEHFANLCETIISNATKLADSLDEVDEAEAESVCTQHGLPKELALLCRRFNAHCIDRLELVVQYFRGSILAEWKRTEPGD